MRSGVFQVICLFLFLGVGLAGCIEVHLTQEGDSGDGAVSPGATAANGATAEPEPVADADPVASPDSESEGESASAEEARDRYHPRRFSIPFEDAETVIQAAVQALRDLTPEDQDALAEPVPAPTPVGGAELTPEDIEEAARAALEALMVDPEAEISMGGLTYVGDLATEVYGAPSVMMGDTMYIIGGKTEGGGWLESIRSVRRGDGVMEEVVEAQLPGPLAIAAAAEFEGDIYVFGGMTPEGETDAILRFDPTTASVHVLEQRLPHPLRAATAAAMDGAVYIFGGVEGRDMEDSILRFDGGPLEILPAHLPIPAAAVASAAIGGDIYLFGGFTGQHDQNLDWILRFDPDGDGALALMPARLPWERGNVAVASDGDVAYLFGGRDYDTRIEFADILRYDPSFGYLIIAPSVLPEARYRAAAGWDGEGFLVAGGGADPERYADVFHYKPIGIA